MSENPLQAPPPVPLIDLVIQHRLMAPEIRDAVLKVFSEQKFILGEEVTLLEQEIAAYCDAREAIGCASGTDALILALMALDLAPGDEVITSPYTFFATASAIFRLGLKPVFVDIDPVSFNMDPVATEAAITPRTKAIMPVHLFGQCVEMDPIWRTATRLGIPIIEDACQAIGAEYRKRRAGVLGTMGCFSFFPTKNLGGAGDGGLITTDDPVIATRLRRLRVHGQTGLYEHAEVGLNSRLDALQAAVLRVKFRSLEQWTLARQRNARRYATMVHEYGIADALTLPTALPDRRHVFNQYCVRVPNGKRDEVLKSLKEQGIGCGVYYPLPLHLQPCFASLGYQPGSMPASELASKETLALPIYPELTEPQQDRVVKALCIAFGRPVKRTLQGVMNRPKMLSIPVRVSELERQ